MALQRHSPLLGAGLLSDPAASEVLILSNLKFSIDCSNRTPAAGHPLGNFGDRHIGIAEEHYDSFYFKFREEASFCGHVGPPVLS